jgi:hypothetical protein
LLRASIASRRFLSSASCSAASFTMRWISASDRPEDAVMVMCCALLVA